MLGPAQWLKAQALEADRFGLGTCMTLSFLVFEGQIVIRTGGEQLEGGESEGGAP